MRRSLSPSVPLRRKPPTRPVAKRKQKYSVRAFCISICIITTIIVLSLTYDAISPHAVRKIQARNQPWISTREPEDIHSGGQGLVKRDAEVLLLLCQGRTHDPFANDSGCSAASFIVKSTNALSFVPIVQMRKQGSCHTSSSIIASCITSRPLLS